MSEHTSSTFDAENIEDTREVVLEPTDSEEEEDIKIYEPKGKESGDSSREQVTKVLDFAPKDNVKKADSVPEGPELEGQMTFENMDEPEDTEPVDSEAEMEEKLQDARREKVENFRLIRNDAAAFRLSGDEGEEEPEEEEEELQDYNSYAETAAVRGELYYRRRSGRIGLMIAGVLEFFLLCLTLLAQISTVPPMESITYLAINLILLAGIMLTAHRVIADGISGLVHLRAGADSVTAVAAFAAEVHTILQFLNLTEVANGAATLYNAVAGLALLLALCGRQYRITRICRNFRLISYKGDKYAASFIESEKQRDQFGRYIQTLTVPEITYLQKSKFLTKFMANSYDDEGHESLFSWFSPVAIALILVFTIAYTFLGGESANWWNAIGVFTSLLCFTSPAFAVAGANLPLAHVGKRLLSRGAVLIGWKTVEAFCDVNALAVDASDVFPGETVLLHGIKTFAGARIDEAILDAAAVSIEAGGPLAGVFRRVIENRTDMLQEVDTLLYEQEMGLSGWVGGRRVLVGNRRLLENHGVDVPSRDYETRYTKDDRQLVYLSTGGELCAMFVVSYTADKGIAETLQCLSRAGVSLLIRTCDPNITQTLVHNVFHIDEESVHVLDTASGRTYEALTAEPTEEAEALLACNGRLEGVGMAISSCRRLRTYINMTGILQAIAAGLGLLLGAVAVVVQAPIAPLLMILYMLGWTCVSWLVGHLRADK